METPPPLPGRPQPDGWLSSWKFIVPLIVLTGVVLIGGSGALILGVLKSSDAYSGAVARARAEPAVIAAVGLPIEEGFFVTGNVSVTNASGHAELEIPIEGPKARATIQVVAEKTDGSWRFERLLVQVEANGTSIDLLENRSDPLPEPGSKASKSAPTPERGSP